MGAAKKFANDSMNWVDVIAVFPFYLKAVVGLFCDDCEVPDLRFVRVIRLARVLRSLPEKYSSMGTIVSDIVNTAALGLLLPLYFMFLSMFVWASLVFYAESPMSQRCYIDGVLINDNWNTAALDETGAVTKGNEGCLLTYGCRCGCDAAAHAFAQTHDKYLLAGETESTKDGVATLAGQGNCAGAITFVTWDGGEHSSDMFDDGRPGGIGTAMWWCVVTFTTVGYGDMMPRTPQGQLFAVLTMITGIFFLAMPLAVVGASFTQAWAKNEASYELLLRHRERERVRELTDEERAQLPVHHIPKTTAQLVSSLSLEAQTRLDVLGYLARMKAMAASTVERCPAEALPEVRAAIAAFTDKLEVVADSLNETAEWRPKQLVRVEDVVLWEDDLIDDLAIEDPTA